ncbi:MAG: hypothetical protein ACOCP8_01310 [archaeon]
MLEIKFKSIEELKGFIFEEHLVSSEMIFNEWEIVIFRVSGSDGTSFFRDTRISDTSGGLYSNNLEYSKLKDEKGFIEYCYNDYLNKQVSMNLEIKLKFPESLRKVIDPNDRFKAFYVDFYAQDGEQSFLLTSFLENNKKLEVKPIKNWMGYIANLYEKYANWVLDNQNR